MQIEKITLDKLIPYARNPRKNDGAIDSVAASIKEFGFNVPLVIDAENTIVCGHTRLKAAQKLGLKTVPCIRKTNLTEQQLKAYRILDNKIAEKSEWDEELLALELEEIEIDLDDFEVDFVDDLPTAKVDTADDEVPEPPAEPFTRLGDVWKCGRHRVMCGDSSRSIDVDRLVDSAIINIAFTSPPYASQRKYDELSGFSPIHPDNYVEWFEPVAANVQSRLAQDGSWFVNIKPNCEGLSRETYVFDLVLSHARKWKWNFAEEFCWERSGIPQQVVRRFKNQFEPIYHFTLGDWKFRPKSVMHESDSVPIALGKGAGDTNAANRQGRLSAVDGNKVDSGMAYPGNRIPKFRSEALGHPAAFPVGLPSFFIKAYTDENDYCYDPFLGSGTTLIAAHRLRRICYGIEISPQYVDVILQRYYNETGETPVRESDGAKFPVK